MELKLKKRIKEGVIAYLISFVFVFVCFAVIIFRIGFPYHRHITILIYLASWVLYLYPIARSLDKKRLEKIEKRREVKWIRRHKTVVSFGIISVGLIYLFSVMFPGVRVDYINIEKGVLEAKIQRDEVYLQEIVETLRGVEERYNYLDLATVNMEEKEIVEEVKNYWRELIDVVLVLDRITEEYKYFYQIDPLRYGEMHERAFLIGYTSFMMRYGAVYDFAHKVNGNDYLKIVLNEDSFGVGSGSFERAANVLINPNELLRVNAGRAYLELKGIDSGFGEVASGIYKGLNKDVKADLDLTFNLVMDLFENQTMERWLPVQKGISLKLSETRFANRERNLISIAQLESVDEELEPGDILVERKNWYISNASMPGFWTHAALYIGDFEKLDDYFADVATEEFGMKFSEYVRDKYGEFYKAKIGSEVAAGNDGKVFEGAMRTIEAKGPGVIQLALEDSANADYLGVLRPRVDKYAKMRAVLKAIDSMGTPYDFNFDFSTDDELVCSELVYKAYGNLKHEMRITAGRKLLVPNHMVEDFDSTYGTEDQQYDFVVFLDGSEKRGSADKMGVNEFRRSWQRPKYDFILNY